MNEYENPDEEDDYSSASFRARSNTWPLNRPDFALPSSGVCIDETLPEIELEDDDLFTTNENWSTGLVDQDIMSWDPILNAQHQQQQQLQQQQQQQQQQQLQQQPQIIQQSEQQQHLPTAQPSHQAPQQALTNQPETIHHHHQQHHHPQAQHQIHQLNNQQLQEPPVQSIHGQHRLNSIQRITHTPQIQQPLHPHHPHPHHHEPQHQHHHQIPPQQQTRLDPHQLPPNDLFIDVASNPKNIILPSQNVVHMPHQHQTQMPQKLSPSQHPAHVHHQTLNGVHCLDSDDPTEYHIQQMHHLSLENNSHAHEGPQQEHYAPTLNSMCLHSPSANAVSSEASYNISSNIQNHQQLQPLASARYDIDPRSEYEVKPHLDDALTQQIEHQSISQQPNHHNPHLMHQHRHHHHHDDEQHQSSHHQIHTASSSLDNQSAGSHILSSSLSTSGIGLSADLEDLDYNQPLDPSHVMLPYDDQQNQSETQPQTSNDVASETKQPNSTSTTKTKLIAPRRNAWGNMSYADLISQAIDSTSDKRLTLSQIYDWMVQHVPYFKDKGDSNSSAGWKNSVRHNLSLHSRFKRIQNEGTGKSSWWTINPEANIGKCARRRAASMEASKYEKKRGRAKKKAEAIRQGLISYPSLSNSSLNGSTTALGQQDSQAQSVNQFQGTLPANQQPDQSQPQLQNLDQFATRQPIPTLDQYPIDPPPSQQQQQQLQRLQQSDAQDCDEPSTSVGRHQNLFIISSQQQQPPQPHSELYEDSHETSKLQMQQQQQQQQQQSQYYYPFELSTAL